ncbi:hemicentin-1-like [Sardina pilchardus]|uniref:hemicentin-1-like n=1 Tax=Sardina pilchardus TaxID=27697 RepID=UPI002E16518A
MDQLAAPQVINCAVTNLATGKTASVTKTVPVADGPLNVTISAPEKLAVGVESTFVCSAICDPSCSYDWFIDHKTWTKDSRELQYTAPSGTKSTTVVCKAQNTLSGLFVESSVTVSVEGATSGEKPKSSPTQEPYGPQSAKISGADAITVGVSYNFSCSAKCYPPCTYTMSIDGTSGHGDYILISIGGPAAPQVISCVAKNPATGAFASASKTVRVADINVGPEDVEIKGVDVVSAGVPCTFDCSAECSPACDYTWNVNGQIIQKYSQIDVNVHEGSVPWKTLPLSCEVRNPATGKTVTVSKTVPVADGPLNVSIAAHKTLVNGDEYTFVCSVTSCLPSCAYSWNIGDQTWANTTNELQYTAPSSTKTTVTCKAQNTLSGLYVEAHVTFSFSGGAASQEQETMETNKPYGPQFLEIMGEDVLTIGLAYSFLCAAVCYPPCTYTWNVNGKIFPGRSIDYTFSGQSPPPEVLNCVAKNPATGKTASVNKTVHASDIIDGPTSVEITGVDVVTVKIPSSFECYANCSPACVYTWSVEGEMAYGSIFDFVLPQFLPPQDLTQNLTLALNCEAKNPATGQTASVSRMVRVAEGPLNVSLAAPPKLVVGATSRFVCTAFCYPSCTYGWVIDGQPWETGSNELQFTTPADTKSATVICKAQNVLTGIVAESAVTVWVEEGPKSVEIDGVDVVTVGVLYTFECLANCSPPCTYTWNVAGKTVQGNKLDFSLHGLSPPQALTCEAKNPMTGKMASFTKTLQVAEGPLNVSIAAPKVLVSGVASTFVCSAVCYPSCNYSWYVGDQSWTNSRTLRYTPPPGTTVATVICKAQNTLSGMFVESISDVWMARGPTHITIKGPSSVMVGNTFSYYCFADCVPACNMTWLFEGRALAGDKVTVPVLQRGESVLGSRLVVSVEDYVQTELLQCTAVNALTGQTESAVMAVNVTDPVAVQPVTVAQPRTNTVYILHCGGAEKGSDIQWTKNGEALSASDSVHLSDDNVFLIFNPLHPSDTGKYQCIVTEQGKVVPGFPYELNVIYGPGTPDITLISGGKILRQTPIDVLRLLPGSSATLHCSSQCYPACTYQWTVGDNVVSTDATFSIRSASEADVGVLLCTASNPDVHTVLTSYTSASLSIELIDGPKTVTITGPSSVQVGVKATFECSAVCTPSCFYTWEVYGKTLHGSKVDLTVSKYVATETIVCKAENTFTEKIATATATIDVTDADWCGC